MKILWITNTLFPEVEQKLLGKGELRGSGGWMLASAEMLVSQKNVQLSVATVSRLVHKLEIINGNYITYYLLPYGKGNLKYNRDYESHWVNIKKMIEPDVVHIHGTEYTHGLAYVYACGSEHVVVSIQGLKSGIVPYYCAGLSSREIYNSITFHDIVKGGMYNEQRNFYNVSKYEKELLRKVNHIIGRTSWDRAHVWAINPDASYYVCNETLRSEFYKGSTWSFGKCVPYSIFLSQGGYPLKGLHQVLKAMPLILRHYPSATIRIAGVDITKNKGLWGLLHFTGYGKIIKKLIKKYDLRNKVIFLGPLNAEQMKEEYLRCNVFVCPSSIENSPNSLGEAQILRVPCVASYAGGIPDFMQEMEKYLYRFEEIEMLSYKICEIFSSGSNIHTNNEDAILRHNPKMNLEKLVSIYNSL